MGGMDRFYKRKDEREGKAVSKSTGGSMDRYYQRQRYKSLDTSSVDDNYIKSFASDASSFLSGVGDITVSYSDANSKLADLGTRFETLQGWLYQNENKLDRDTYSSFSKMLNDFQSSFEGAKGFYSQFESEDDYQNALRVAGYQKKYDGKSYEEIMSLIGELEDGAEKEWLNSNKYKFVKSSSNYDSVSSTGWESYLADAEKAAQPDSEEKWYEKIARYLGTSPDTSLPMGTTAQVVNDLRNDTSYLKPSSDWDDEQKGIYGYLYGIGEKSAAAEYARYTNEANNKADNEEKIVAIEEWATKNGFNGAVATLASIAMMPLSLADTLSALTEYNARGFVSTPETPMPGQISNAITSAISSTLNESSGTINENIPVIGGKGIGDAYQIGTSIANSMLSAYTQGTLGTYMVFFGSASASGMYEKKANGATDEQALTFGILSGLAEAAGEAFSVDKLLGRVGVGELKGFFKNVLLQAGIEASEEGVTTLLNNFSDQLVMGDKSNFDILVNYYMAEENLSHEEAKKKAWKSMANDLAFDMLSGAISGGFSSSIQTGIQTGIKNAGAKELYGDGAELVTEALEINPNNAYAQRLKSRVDSEKNLTGGQINRLVEANETSMLENDVQAIRSAVENRLSQLGERGDVKAIAAALTKQAQGKKLTFAEKETIKSSTFGQRVANELNTENIKGGGYSSAWAERIGTDRINPEEYSRLIAEIEDGDATVSKMEQVENATDVQQVTGKLPASEANVHETANAARYDDSVVETDSAREAEATAATENVPKTETAAESEISGTENVEEESAVTLEDASKKYGAQAGAMISTYNEGQDVAQYDAGYSAAYNMGKSGVNLSYAMNSEATAYLTESQRELAHAAGADSGSATAKTQDAANKAKANGKTGRRKGVVRGEGVSISDLKASFNDTQGTAYKILSTYAEATGVDIVLYRSEANESGDFEGAQGRFKWSEDTIYIDINAGLANIKSVNDLAKYTMLRTFSHEFTHFIEKWNPVQYNEFRKVVFDTLTERGENVNSLIETKMSQSEGMSYEKASREVVAEAMTDILPDANFVEELATKHKNIFNKLIEMLKEFVADLKAYFNTIKQSPSAREAKALKEQVGEAVKYVDNIVKMFDKIAVEAVENYQMTVAIEEAAPASEAKEATNTEKDGSEFTITDNAEYGTLEIKFEGKPSEAVRDVLKEHKFRWHKVKGVWYGKADRATIVKALRRAYKAEEAVVSSVELTAEEEAAILAYKSGGSYTLNAKLREGIELDEFEQQIVNGLDKALEKLPICKGEVYRNIQFDGLGDKEARDAYIAMHIVGETILYNAFTSSSTAVDGYVLEGDFLVHHVIQSSNGRNLEGLGNNFESEVLFSRTAYYVTDRIVYDSDGTPTIYLTEVSNGQQAENGEGRNQQTPSVDNRGQQETPDVSDTSKVQRLQTLDPENGEVQAAVSERDTASNHDKQGELQGVPAEVNADPYAALSDKLDKSYSVHQNELNFAIMGDENKGYYGIIKRDRKGLYGVYPIENASDRIYRSAVFKTRQEAIDDIVLVAKISELLKQEVKPNGKNADNTGTVQHTESDRQGDTRVLDEVQTADVQGDAPRGDSVGDSVERGRQTVRDDSGTDNSARARRGSSEGDSESTDLRRDDGLTTFAEAKAYAEEKGYKIELNKLSAKKRIIQVDISDKQGLPTFNPVIIGELGKGEARNNWNKVKEAIDEREAVDKSATDTKVGDKTTEESSEVAAEKLHEEVTEQIAQQSTEQPKGRNFVIGDSLDLPNGEKSRYKANVEAIRLVKQLEAEGRYATEAEQAVLSKYVGWGGLANAFDQRKTEWAKEYTELKELLSDEEYASARGSTLNAHYTDISVIKAMYDGLAKLGFNGGRMLEPSSGVGNFVGAMPAAMSAKVKSWTMVELDGITGLIAKYLYPNADVRIQGFEKANIPDNYMDVAISNVPFGNYAIADKAYPKRVTSAIHNYFFAKTLDKVRPGGIVMFITSSYTMNSKDDAVRRYIMQRADLLGAIRLPDSAFKGNAGTEVVTDIIVLKKRAANTAYAGEDFLEAPYKYISNYNGAYINSYFDAHPEMVLGTPTMDGGMYRGNNLTYKALEGKGSLADQIREAFSHIKGKMEYPATLSREKTNFAVERATKTTKENGLVVKGGKVYQNKGGELVEVSTAKGAAERITSLLEIRDVARNLMNYQQQGINESEIRAARSKLNKAYDAFVKKYGFINAQANRNAIREDPDSYSIYALENWNPETKKATKADIFTKNTIAPNRTVTSAKDVAEGLIVSVNQTGGVDTALIAKLTGKTEEDVTRELIDTRKAFKNRNGDLEAAEVYLSGNVRAKLRDAEALAPIDSDYKNNVEALKSVIPEDVGYEDIFVNPGTPWIPNSVYSDFAAYMLGGRNSEYRQDVDVTRNADTGNFTVELKSRYLKTNAANTQKWGTSRRTFLDLFDAMLNSKSVVIKDKLEDGSFIVNKDATAAANEKIENIQKEFQDWLWRDEARRGELVTLYNETFNSVVTPKYNGDNLTVNGANAIKPLRPHQRNAVQRVISSGGNTLLAHKVGAGKTYEMAAAAMKLKELGLVKKPMFVVPKSLVAQWGVEFKDFFPLAKLLVAEATDFATANRKVFMNRIANGEYDAVIVSYEQFEKLPMSDDFTRELYQEQIDSVIAAIEEAKADKGDKALSVKDLEKKRKSLQTKIDKLTDKAKDEGNIDFEQLGVDSLFVDEAHNFKNLFYTTSMTNVSGLGNKDGSKRAFDLYTKVRYLQQFNGGRGIVFATATPVMNSMSEMYIMQKYLQPDLLNQLGLSTFDAWAKQFGEVVNGVEIKPSGQGYRVKQSFSRFKNMSELQLLFRNFADVLTDIPGLKIPKMKGGKVNVIVCEPGQFQQDFMKELEKRADNIKNVDPSEDNMLKITSDGRKISYTQRMIDPSLPYEEGCKIFRCADNVIKEYNDSNSTKGTQLIFCDMATPKGKSNNNATETEDIETDSDSTQLYEDIKTRLRQGGIPAKEIAFIHEADTDQKKKKLFADVNDGKVRVLIGSTGKMGVGMNAQKRIVAIHHLDAPWRPGDVEQRDGRAFRQGNINDEVSKYTYVTEGSFDARLWDILERKQNFINQVMNGESVGRETEDTGEVTLSAAEVKALASGSPLIMEQVQLDTDIKKLESLYRAHLSAIRSAKERLSRDTGEIARYEKLIANGNADAAARIDTYSEGKFSITIGKQKFTDKKEAGTALMAAATAKAVDTEYTTIGSFAGFDVRVIKTHEGIKGILSGKQGYPFNTYPERTTFMITHISGVAESIDEKVKLWQHNLTEVQNDIEEQEKLIAAPFGKQAELDQKRARYTEVMDKLNPKEEQSLDSVADDTVQEQSRAYLGAQDSDGNTLTQKQAEYFKDSKARDKSGNLLVLYHGTVNAGFTVFEPSRGKFGGSWFTTSRKDADSYGGNYSHKLFDPNETDDVRTSEGGNYTLGSWMRFDTEADRADFLRKYPNAENIKTDAEYDALLSEVGKARDWDEYDRLEEEQAENRKELKKLQKAYGIYEWEHSREATIGELFENPERFTASDVLRAWDAYDSNNAARDEEYTKEELIEGLRAVNEERIADGDSSFEEFTFKARIPVGEVGQIVNHANNRTYAVYANVTNPYIIDARHNTLAGANLYPAIEEGMSAREYDGVIVRNARVGAHQEIGDVVIIKESGQVKLTSNKTPTPHSDISYQQRTNTLSDREVLQMAAEKLEENGDKMSDAERDALRIFKDRLSTLYTLQEERTEQGRLYREQQFGANVDRAAAEQTLNRMHILDDKIKAANDDVLSIENKKVLGDVLKKARAVVEAEQRSHDAETLKRWRDRTKNAAAIKKYRERIKTDVNDLTSWVLKPNNKDIVKHIPDALKNSVIPFLASIDFTSKQQLRGGEATKADAEFVKRLNALNAALKQNITLNGLYSGYNDLPPNFMDKLQDFINVVQDLVSKNSGEFVVNKMTSEELKELSGVVRILKAYITQINKFHANAMYQHVYEAGDNTIESLSTMESDNGRTGNVSNFVFWQQMRPAYAFERFGEGGKAVYDGLRRGQAQLAFNTQKIVEFSEKAYTDAEVKAWEKEIKTIKLGGHSVKMRVSDIMSFYELSKQPDSLRHMLGEGFRVATYSLDGKKISDNGHAISENDIADIVSTLTQRQKDVADAMQKFMQEQGAAWGNYVSVKRFGEELFTNEQYFPINSDGRHLQATADEAPSNASLYALLNMSFTKSRNELANNRIIIYSIFDVFANHMASMAQYNAMALPVLDAIKWFNYQQKTEDHEGNKYVKDAVREQMDRVYGVSEETKPGRGNSGYAQSFVLNIIKAFNGTEAQGIPTDTLGMNTIRRYNMAQIAYNFRVVLQQPLAITRAALLIDYGSIVKGLKLKPKLIQQNIQEMRKYSGIAAWKSLGFYDVNISRGLTDTIKHKSDLMDKIGDVGMWGAEKADTLTWAAMWSACKEEVIKKQKLRPSDKGFYEAVTNLFEDVIYKTQVVDSILTKNEFMRSKGFFARAVGSFMSEPTTTASMVVDAVDKFNTDMRRGLNRQQSWEKNKRMIGRTVYVYAVSAVILAAVQAVADGLRDDDDYETFIEKWLEAFGGNLVDELLPINKLPILSDFYDLAKELLSIFGVDTYGNPPQSVFMQWYDSLVKGVQIMYEKIAGEDTNYTYYAGIYKLLQAVSGMTSLPMASATREIITAWNNTIGAMAPSLKVKTYDPGEMNEIKYAYNDGYLTFDEAVQELLEQGLVDNENEAYFTVSGWEAGDGYSRYDAVYDAVRNGGSIDEAMQDLVSHGYTEKDVYSQISGKVGEWYKDGEISKSQAVSMLEKYTELDSDEITKRINKWSCKVVTGIDYDDIGDEYIAGNISEQRAKEMYMRYGGETEEKAAEKVTVLEFVKAHPEVDGISFAAVSGYTEYCEPQGIDVNVFYDVWQYKSSAKGDKDKNGKTINGSVKEKVLDYIDSLDLSNKQKTALYYAMGYAKSELNKAPWR